MSGCKVLLWFVQQKKNFFKPQGNWLVWHQHDKYRTFNGLPKTEQRALSRKNKTNYTETNLGMLNHYQDSGACFLCTEQYSPLAWSTTSQVLDLDRGIFTILINYFLTRLASNVNFQMFLKRRDLAKGCVNKLFSFRRLWLLSKYCNVVRA